MLCLSDAGVLLPFKHVVPLQSVGRFTNTLTDRSGDLIGTIRALNNFLPFHQRYVNENTPL